MVPFGKPLSLPRRNHAGSFHFNEYALHRSHTLSGTVLWCPFVDGPNGVAMPGLADSGKREFRDLLIPSSQNSEAVAFDEDPVKPAYTVGKVVPVGGIENGKFLIQGQAGNPLRCVAIGSVVFGRKQVGVLAAGCSAVVFHGICERRHSSPKNSVNGQSVASRKPASSF